MTKERPEGNVDMRSPTKELWQSIVLIGLTISSLGAYVGLAFAAVRLFSSR